jgi:hypothetical protein
MLYLGSGELAAYQAVHGVHGVYRVYGEWVNNLIQGFTEKTITYLLYYPEIKIIGII